MAADDRYDTPHPLTVRPAGHKAGCYNRTGLSDGYWHHGTRVDEWGIPVPCVTWVPHEMSTRCRQLLPLPECEGCTAPKDLEYIARMRPAS